MKPALPITDPRFRYVPSILTDIRKTFDRVRQEIAQQTKARNVTVVLLRAK
jgi:hypothetical protein